MYFYSYGRLNPSLMPNKRLVTWMDCLVSHTQYRNDLELASFFSK